MRTGIQRLVCCSSGSLSPASKLDAGRSHGVSRLHPTSRQHVSTSAYSASTTRPSGCLTIMPRLALSCRHALSGPVSSPRCTSLSIPSAVHHRHPTFVLLCFFPRVLVRSVWHPLTSRTTSNSQAWTPTLQYGHSTYRLYPLEFLTRVT